MQTQSLIHAKDFLQKEPKLVEGSNEEVVAETETLALRIFGTIPDYTQPEFEELWQEVFNAEDKDMIAYCLSKGVDVLGDDNFPVSGWRDVAVVLKAVEKGILSIG